MNWENEKFVKGTKPDNGEAPPPLFSAFRQKPRPAPAPAPARAPAPPPPRTPPACPPAPAPAAQEKSPATRQLETRLAELEMKLQESAQREIARAPEKGILDYLKTRVGELENKLQESQEKESAFAYKLKRREDARKESQREIQEVLAAMKQQQSAAEAGLLQAAELEKFRMRMEALERGLMKISAQAPAAADLSSRAEELAGKLEGACARIGELGGKLEAVSVRLDFAEKAAKLADNVAAIQELETKILGSLEKKLDTRLKHEFSALEKEKIDFMGNSVTNMAHFLSARLGEIREAIRYLSSDAARAGIEADRSVEWIRALLDKKGRAAAENIAGSYDLGFIQASLDNLENSVASSMDALDNAWADAEQASSLPAMTPELRTRRHAAALKSAVDSLKDNLDTFRDIRQGIVRNLRKSLTGG